MSGMLINLISVAFFSAWQQHMIIFLHCARFNPDVRFTLITNLDETHPSWREQFGSMTKPSNVVFAPYTFEQLVEIIRKDNLGLGMSTKLHLSSAYKLIDYKPMYGRLFSKELEGYSHWGWFDLDIYMGDIKAIYECGYANEDFMSYDHVSVHGPLMIMRNTEVVNNFYLNMLKYPAIRAWFERSRTMLFDERFMPTLINKNSTVTLRHLKNRNCDNNVWMWYKGMMQNSLSTCVIYHFGGGGVKLSKFNKLTQWNRVKAFFSGYHESDQYGFGSAHQHGVGTFSFVFTIDDMKSFKIVNTTSGPDFDIKKQTRKLTPSFKAISAKFNEPSGGLKC